MFKVWEVMDMFLMCFNASNIMNRGSISTAFQTMFSLASKWMTLRYECHVTQEIKTNLNRISCSKYQIYSFTNTEFMKMIRKINHQYA